MNKPAPAPKVKEAPKKIYKVFIQFYPDVTAMIVRKNLPAIIDKTEAAVRWLKDNGFTNPEDIEVIGTKPECWNEVYPPATTVIEPAPVEMIAAVLDGQAPAVIETVPAPKENT